jgi:hypothetical protein
MAPACGGTIGLQHPHPNVALTPQPKTLRLVLAGGIQDHLAFHGASCDIDAWRETLADGFRNGFASAYRLTTGDDADLTLTLDEVRLEIGDFEPAQARIQYKATLSDRSAVLRRSAGTAAKASGGISAGGFPADVSGAVEAMYEQIAQNLWTGGEAGPPPAPAAAPPRCVPGQSSACAGPKGCPGFQVCSDKGTYDPCSCGG